MPRQTLDERSVSRLAYAEKGRSYYAMDLGLPNFGVRVYENRRMWVVRFRGKTEEFAAADGPQALGILNARRKAEKRILELKQDITQGVKERFLEHARRVLSPDDFERVMASVEAELRSESGDSHLLERHRVAQWTLQDLFDRLKGEILEERGETASVRNKLSRWRRYVLPAFRAKRVQEFSEEYVEELKRRMKATPAAFNATRDHLCEGFHRCAKWRPPWRTGPNPVEDVEKYPPHGSEEPSLPPPKETATYVPQVLCR